MEKMKEESNLVKIENYFDEKSQNFRKARDEHSKAEFLSYFAANNGLEMLTNFEEYFIISPRLNLAEDFQIKNVSFGIDKDSDYSRGENFTNFYFDFFFNVEHLNEKIPIFIHHKNFSEDEHKVAYSRVFERGEMDYKKYNGLRYKKESIIHPKSIEEILLIQKGRGLNEELSKKLEESIVKFRKENPAFSGEKERYAKIHYNLGDQGTGWTSCGNCGKTLEDYGKTCPFCESNFVGSREYLI
ncbi:MAG: hypothetical protein Q8Q04_00605 [archaeon]|nr:hypothetical protein [archaeon]